MANLKIDKLNKSYGNAAILQDIDLSIDDGEFVVLVGPSGCGKSTLLRMIAGLDGVSSGDIFIGERRVNNLEPSQRKIAMVFQSYALYPHMNVKKNMTFGLKFAGMAQSEMDRRVAEAARMLHLEPLLNRRPRDLSGGQRQRVAIGRAIVREPDVFLFDEPLSNLDAALRVSTRVEIAKLHRQLGATMVYVTHDQVEAMTLADRIVVMNGGRIAQAGKPLDLYYHPNNLFVAGFIGSPAMNILDAVVDRKDAGRVTLSGRCVAPFDLAAANFAAPAGAKLKIGVRPEHLSPEHLSPEHLSPEHLSPEHLSPEHLGPPRASGFKIAGVVELVERLGETSFAYVRLAEDVVVTAEMRGRDAPKAGEAISLGVAERDLHLFGEDGECVPIG